jgi:hypothetical protein
VSYLSKLLKLVTKAVILLASVIYLLPGLASAVPHVPPFGIYPGAQFSPSINVLESSDHDIRLEVFMSNLPTGGTINMNNHLPGLWGELNDSGASIPRFTIYLALPPHGTPTAAIEQWDKTSFQASPAFLADNSPPLADVTVGFVGNMAGVRLVPVTFRPVLYANGAAICSVMTHAVVRIDIDSTTGANPVSSPPLGFSRTWRQVYQSLVTNWKDIPNIWNTLPSRIVMIVPDGVNDYFLPMVDNFVRWKQQRGYQVTVIPRSSIAPAPNSTQVRSRIQQELSVAPRPDFLILVGDETELPTSSQFTNDPASRFSSERYQGSFTNELFYSSVQGTDLFPDIFVGRWVVNTQEEARKIASRSVLHEKTPFISDSLRFAKALMAADVEDPTQAVTKRHVRDVLLGHGFTHVDTLWGQFVQPSQFTSIVNNGVGFVNYRGTGWSQGWAGINVYYWTIQNEIANSRMLPIVTGIGCGVGIFNVPDNTGFGENWMTAGTVQEPFGAAGFIGPCWNTHTVYNNNLDSSLYRAWFDCSALQLAPGLAIGKMMVWAMLEPFLVDGSVAEVTNTMFRQYIVQGDPSLQIYSDTPQRLQVFLPAAVPPSPSVITVTIGNMSALEADSLNVTAWVDSANVVTGWINHDHSSLSLPVNPNGADTVVVTVTGDNTLAYSVNIPVALAAPESHDPSLPVAYALESNYPNPFNSETVLRFAVPHASHIRLEVFDILGKQVTTLVDGQLPAGYHQARWAGQSGQGEAVGTGVYFARMITPEGMHVRKLLLLK